MSTLKELLKDVQVEWKDLDEICNIVRGVTYNKSLEVSENGLKVLRANNISVKHSELNFNDIKQISIEAKVKSDQKLYKNDILISVASGSKEHVGKVAFIYENIDYYFGGFMAVIRTSDKVFPKYAFQILKSKYFSEFLDATLESSTINNLSNSVLKKFQIPIPYHNDPEKSLEIQQEIVRVLDGLSEQNKGLTIALAQEIDQRKKQYEYYREELFSFEGKEVEWKKISEIGTFQRGKRFVRTDMISEGVPCIHYGEMYTHYGTSAKEAKSFLSENLVSSKKLRVAEKNDVVIVAAGETIEDIGKGTAWLGDEGVVIHDACFSYRSQLNPVYFAYFTRTILFHDQIRRNISSSKISAINEKGFNKVCIPVPTIQEQERIVRLLDQFDEASKSIVAQLEKEIELRNKQFEYYRNLILSFPKEN